jgi:hypothetical protein
MSLLTTRKSPTENPNGTAISLIATLNGRLHTSNALEKSHALNAQGCFARFRGRDAGSGGHEISFAFVLG